MMVIFVVGFLLIDATAMFSEFVSDCVATLYIPCYFISI